MRAIGATACSVLLTTLIACGASEDRGEIGAGTATRAPSLSTDCTGLVPATVPSGFSTTVQLSDACGPMGATSDGVGNYSVGKTCGGNGFEIWNVVDAQGTFHANNMAFRTTFDPADERQERHLLAQPAGGFLTFNWQTDGTGSAEVGSDGTVIVQGRTQLSDTGEIPTESVTQRFYPQMLR